MTKVYCKCGCGKVMPNSKLKLGCVFYSRRHYGVYRTKISLQGKEYKAVKKNKQERHINYSLGKGYCKKYNNENIKCVVCYEQDLKCDKGCFE